MPDSFTKFKEDPPSKRSASGGESGEVSTTPTPTPVPSDLIYEIDEVFLFQSQGDYWLFEVADADGFEIGDTLFASKQIVSGSGYELGTLVDIRNTGGGVSGNSRVFLVRLDGAGMIDFDNLGFYDTDILSEEDVNLFNIGTLLDNCGAGYGACAVGSSALTQITSPSALYVPPTAPSLSLTTNVSKRIYIKRGATATQPLSNLKFEYTFSTPTLGIGVDLNNTTNTAGTFQRDEDNSAFTDRLQSPFGPFLPSTLDFVIDPLTITVSLHPDSYGTELDPEETADLNLFITSILPGTSEGVSAPDFELSYYHENNDKIAIVVDNTNGFEVGNTVHACRFNVVATCDPNAAGAALTTVLGNIKGRGTILYVDDVNRVVVIQAQSFDAANDGVPLEKSLFSEGDFIHTYDPLAGNVVTFQLGDTARIYDASTTLADALVPDFNEQNVNDDPDDEATPIVVNYSATGLPSGVSLDSNGNLDINTSSLLALDQQVTITATNQATGVVLDTFTLTMSFFGSPSAVVLPNGTSAQTFNGNINVTQETITPLGVENIVTPPDNSIYRTVRFAVSSGTLPAGVTLDPQTGVIDFSPTEYVNNRVVVIDAFHPPVDNVTPFSQFTVTFNTATLFDRLVFPQQQNDRLIIEVTDVSNFVTENDNTSNTPNLASNNGAVGIVTGIDETNRLLFVRIPDGVNYTGADAIRAFSTGDQLDSTGSFVVQRATITDVTHVFRTDDTNEINPPAPTPNGNGRLFTTSGIKPEYFVGDIHVPNLAAGETVSFAISPSLPADLELSVSGAPTEAFIRSNNVANNGNLASMPATEYTLVAANGIGVSTQGAYKFIISEAPSDVSVGRYQFIRLKNNGNKFKRGSYISVNGQDGRGRVLMTVQTVNGGPVDGLLVEYAGDIPSNAGIDNNISFVAAETTVEPYAFLYLKDTTGINDGDVLTTGSGGEFTVEGAPVGDRIYGRITGGTITDGQVFTQNTSRYLITNVADRHYVTGALQVNNAGALNAIQVGGYLSSDNYNGTANDNVRDSAALVVQRSFDSDLGEHYVLIQELQEGGLSGKFGEGDNLSLGKSGAFSAIGHIDAVVGPNIDISLNPAPGSSTPLSSSLKLANGTTPFWEGSQITGFQDRTPTPAAPRHRSTGFAVYGTNFGSNLIRVSVEDFSDHFKDFRRGTPAGTAGGFIDDFNEDASYMDDEVDHNDIEKIELSNLIIGYVGEPLHIEPVVKGKFSSISISPDVLPDGLLFDSTTGRITGVPTTSFSGGEFTIKFLSADDGVTTTDYSFPLVIYNHFTIEPNTPSASSYVIHREGQGFGTSRCRVISPQINDDVSDSFLYNQSIYGTNDVICLLEAGEADLFNEGLTFNIGSGAGMCEFVRYRPYGYTQVPAGSTDSTFVRYEEFEQRASCSVPGAQVVGTAVTDGYVTPAALTGAGNRPLAGREFGRTYCDNGSTTCTTGSVASAGCQYDYSLVNSSLPNVDEGSYQVRSVACSVQQIDVDDSGTLDPGETFCDCSVSEPEITECGGDARDSLEGPLRALFPNIEATAIVYNAFGSLDQNVTIPAGTSYLTERGSYDIANYMRLQDYGTSTANSCMRGTYNFDIYDGGAGPTNITDARLAWSLVQDNGTPFSVGAANPYYEFECLDAARDTKAVIKVVVRDWDREFTPDDPELELLQPTAKMDDSTTNCFGLPCNNNTDIDNIINGQSTVASLFETTSCGNNDGVLTSADFPTFSVAVTPGWTVTLRENRDFVVASANPSADTQVGQTIVIDPTGLAIHAKILSVANVGGEWRITVDKLMLENTAGLNVEIKRGIPLFPYPLPQ